MQTSAPPLLTDSPLPCSAFSKLEVAARLIKNGNAAMSREDKAAFGIDTWLTQQDTPDALNVRVAAFLRDIGGQLQALHALVETFETTARNKFASARHQPTDEAAGRRLIEHGAMCYFNAAQALKTALGPQAPAASATPALLELDTPVKLIGSAETGTIVGRAEYIGSTPQYQVRYVNGQGCLNSVWWSAEAIELLQANAPEQPA